MSTPTPTGVGAVPPRVGFFVTCLTDLFRPNVGFAIKSQPWRYA